MEHSLQPQLLLVEKDEVVAAQLRTALGKVGSVTRLENGKQIERWLSELAWVDLVLVDQLSEYDVVTAVRNNPTLGSTPILTLGNQTEKVAVETTPLTGVTDLLLITNELDKLLSKVSYYLDLNRNVLSATRIQKNGVVEPLKLPWWKRAIDIAVSLTLLILMSPVLVLVAILIRIDSKGPIMYRSKRAGAFYHVFDMYKFRTMKVRADQEIGKLADHNIYAKTGTDDLSDDFPPNGSFLCASCREKGVSCQQPLFGQNETICEKLYLRENEEVARFLKFRNDPRITRFGKFLRNSSIDELPQLLNVLFGDMSLVGNRPLPLYEAERLTTDEFAQRFAGPAGLTGLWQIKKRAKGQGPMSDHERIMLDIEYANTFSFRTDMYIIWRTIFSLWQKENV